MFKSLNSLNVFGGIMDYRTLVEAAFEARNNSYAPYSKYRVGAALLTRDSKIFLGSNVENASYGLCNCAERTAIFKAVSEGYREFCAIAIAGGVEDGNEVSNYAYPCGACRQVMREFCNEDFVILVAKNSDDIMEYALKELLPNSFGPNNL